MMGNNNMRHGGSMNSHGSGGGGFMDDLGVLNNSGAEGHKKVADTRLAANRTVCTPAGLANTAAFGNLWGQLSQNNGGAETKVQSQCTANDPSKVLQFLSRACGLQGVDFIANTGEAIFAGNVAQANNSICLVHTKIVPGGVATTVRSHNQQVTQMVARSIHMELNGSHP
eukprot:g4341.t1